MKFNTPEASCRVVFSDSRSLPDHGANVSESNEVPANDEAGKPAEYEAPKVEQTVSAQQLEREVQYAGTVSRAPA